MRILQADDDIARIASIEVTLGREDFKVYSTDDGDETVELAKIYDYDLIVLGDVTGAQRVLQQLRTAKIRTPVLRLSSSGDAAAALDAGADDYMIFPPDPPELVARIHAIVRRSRGHAASVVTVGDLSVNLTSKTVTVCGKPTHLTGKEYQMLELLALRKGNCVSKEQFLSHLYGGMDEPEIKIIDVFICKLRKKLAQADVVETVWGRGYMLRDPAAEVTSVASEMADLVNDPPVNVDVTRSSRPSPASLARSSEVRDLMDDPPVYVSRRTSQEAEAVNAKKRFGTSHKEATLVPAAGQK